jgi:formate dehydrogenase subunit delta
MSDGDLVRMANQIAHFFAPYPDADAIDGVRDHLEKFWTRAMRVELQQRSARSDHGLDSLVTRAIETWPNLSRDAT